MDNELAFQDFLFNDVLLGDRAILPKHTDFDLASQFPYEMHLSLLPDNDKTMKIEKSITAGAQERALIVIPVDSKYVMALGNTVLERHRAIETHLEEDCELTRGDDYIFTAAHPYLSNNSISPSPSEYMLSINQSAFHKLAMETLRKLADSHQGAKLLETSDTRYRQQFISENSRASIILTRIVGYANLVDKDWKELKDIASASDNFNFILLLDRLPGAPKGFVKKTTKTLEGAESMGGGMGGVG